MSKKYLSSPKIVRKNAVVIILCTVVLAVFGCVMVYSATMYTAKNSYDNEYYFLIKQIIGVVLGFAAMMVTYFIDYHKYKRFKWLAIIAGFVCLILVFIPGIGVSNYGAKRWIGLPGFTVQGSEIAKFGFILFCAAYLCDKKDSIYKFKTLLPVLLIGGAMCLLIILEPNMSITMVVGIVMLLMLFVGGARIKHFVMLAVPALAVVPLLIIIEPYRFNRLVAFINPWATPQGEGYQLIQSLYSLGSGGIFGVGLFQSRQKFQFLPFPESDFIFSIIGEELGLLGSICVVLLFFFLIKTIISVAKNCLDRFGCYLAVGIGGVIAVQVLINLAVVTGSIPPTGVPLPLISAGSSSLIVFMAAIGIVLNINKQMKLNLTNK